MPRRQFEINMTYLLADGTALTDENFVDTGFDYKAENNVEHTQWCEPRIDSNYVAKEGLRAQYRKSEDRRRELEAQQAAIAEQLQKLT